tara:strand:+ start:171 stop:662 length:492 start_codon:yes stop_codon:yes gene_type:complete
MQQLENQITLVQTPEEFLQDFSIYNYTDPAIIRSLQTLVVQGNAIGAGGRGSIYNLYDAGILLNIVLKVSENCPTWTDQNNVQGNGPRGGAYGQMCRAVNSGDIIFRIPNTKTGKMTILVPNYISEVLCGILLSRLIHFTPSFMQIKGFQYDNVSPTKPMYII